MKKILVLILIIAGFCFYWYSYRPQEIKKRCWWAALDAKDFDEGYKICLQSKGL